MIQDFRERIVSGQADFANLAKAESHCSSASRGGDLGEFGPGQMQAAFEDVSTAAMTGCTQRANMVDGAALDLKVSCPAPSDADKLLAACRPPMLSM